MEGWDSYWACNDTPRSGFNGVCTYARQGTVQEAHARPFGDKELDVEGRAIVTVHGRMAILNVYVPCGHGAAKVRFLEATRRVAQVLRARGLKVVVVGDLNLSSRACDVFFKWRMVSLHPPSPLLPPSVSAALPRLL